MMISTNSTNIKWKYGKNVIKMKILKLLDLTKISNSILKSHFLDRTDRMMWIIEQTPTILKVRVRSKF